MKAVAAQQEAITRATSIIDGVDRT